MDITAVVLLKFAMWRTHAAAFTAVSHSICLKSFDAGLLKTTDSASHR
jgi:hypothetical protein